MLDPVFLLDENDYNELVKESNLDKMCIRDRLYTVFVSCNEKGTGRGILYVSR